LGTRNAEILRASRLVPVGMPVTIQLL